MVAPSKEGLLSSMNCQKAFSARVLLAGRQWTWLTISLPRYLSPAAESRPFSLTWSRENWFQSDVSWSERFRLLAMILTGLIKAALSARGSFLQRTSEAWECCRRQRQQQSS